MESASGSRSLLTGSGQRARLVMAYWAFCSGVLIIWLTGSLLGPTAGWVHWALLGAGACAFTVGAITAVFFVRCPKCGVRWVPWAIGHESMSKWVQWLLVFESCPRCGHGTADHG